MAVMDGLHRALYLFPEAVSVSFENVHFDVYNLKIMKGVFFLIIDFYEKEMSDVRFLENTS